MKLLPYTWTGMGLVAAVAGVLGLAGFGSHATVRGSGTAKQEVRQVPAFTAVEVHGSLRAEITGQKDQRVEISGDDNLVPLVTTEVRGKRLIIEPRDHASLDPKLPLLIRVATPRLSAVGISGASEASASGLAGDLEVSASGASRLSISGLAAEKLGVTASGASWVTLKGGQGKELKARLSGASGLHAREVRAEIAAVTASGASQAEICASKSLDVDLSGASHASAYCNPAQVRQDLSGASSLDRK